MRRRHLSANPIGRKTRKAKAKRVKRKSAHKAKRKAPARKRRVRKNPAPARAFLVEAYRDKPAPCFYYLSRDGAAVKAIKSAGRMSERAANAAAVAWRKKLAQNNTIGARWVRTRPA